MSNSVWAMHNYVFTLPLRQYCSNVHFVLAAVTVTIDIEKRVVNVTENQKFVEVCLIKSGPSSRPVMALVNAEELTGDVGSPREPLHCL